MNRPVVLAALICAAPIARADPGAVSQSPDQQVTDGIDDEPLARDLRGAFGRNVSHCAGDHCRTELATVWCAPASGCRATDRLTGRLLTATGATANTLAHHLLAIGSDDFDAGRTAAWRLSCRAAGRIDGARVLHGHCFALAKAGDDVLVEAIASIMGYKLGGGSWSGRLQIACTSARGPCHLTCDQAAAGDWQHCAGGSALDVATPAFAAAVSQRSGALSATLECRGWRAQSSDAGLTDVEDCSVTRM